MEALTQSLMDSFNALLESVWFELTFLVVVALFAGFLFARFGQPKVIGYILIGVVIGPSLLGIISAPEQEGGAGVTDGVALLPETIMMLAELGSLVLLFMIGLECDLREIYTRKSVSIAIGGVIIPWVGGFAVASLAGYDIEAVFIGATLVATSVAVTASVMSELGLVGGHISNAIVGAAVVDDILGMIVLSISKGMGTGGGIDAIGLVLLAIGAVVFVVVGAWIGTRFLVRLVFDVQIRGYKRKLPLSGFTLALAIAFLYAFIGELIGISAIVGAFVAGTIFAGSALRDGIRKGTQYLEALFVPLFFVSLGVVVDVGEMWNTIVLGVALTVVAIATKVVGCGIPAWFGGMNKWDSIAVGIGMAPRLEVALVIADYGLSTGIIGADLYSVVVFMGLVTAIVSAPALKHVLKRGGYNLDGI
jgi:Kef-type K+ transport system membrane component KefB